MYILYKTVQRMYILFKNAMHMCTFWVHVRVCVCVYVYLQWQPLDWRTLDREAHAACRLDVLSAWGDQEAEAAIVGLEKEMYS